WSTFRFLQRRMAEQHYDAYKIRIGRSLLLGLEVLVAADIVKTIALELTFTSLGLLAGLVLVRTFLSWTLVLEIESRWPWQREKRWGAGSGARGGRGIEVDSVVTSIRPEPAKEALTLGECHDR